MDMFFSSHACDRGAWVARKPERAFTLLEVMVALSILAISLTAIFNINSSSIYGHVYAKKLTVATLLSEEAQVTAAVRSWVVLSVKVPVAVNCSVSPLAMLGFGGVTAMDTSVAAVTVNVAAGETT